MGLQVDAADWMHRLELTPDWRWTERAPLQSSLAQCWGPWVRMRVSFVEIGSGDADEGIFELDERGLERAGLFVPRYLPATDRHV